MAGTKKKHTDYVIKHPGTPTKQAMRKTTPKGGKFPASPHEMEGQFEKGVGAQTKRKKF
jgi:hypothetical protein